MATARPWGHTRVSQTLLRNHQPWSPCSLEGRDWGSSKLLSGFGDCQTSCLHLHRAGAPRDGLVGGKQLRICHQLVQPQRPTASCTVRPWAVLPPLCASVSPRGPWGELPELPLGRVERPPGPGERPVLPDPPSLLPPPIWPRAYPLHRQGRRAARWHPGGPCPVHARQPLLPFPAPCVGAQPHLIIQPAQAAGGGRWRSPTINLSRELDA